MTMLSYLNLIRWPNILIIIMVQVVIAWKIIQYGITQQADSQVDTTILLFFIISCASVLAFGNIVNDIFDVNIDKKNQKDNALINAKITVNHAKILAMGMAFIAIASAILIDILRQQLIITLIIVVCLVLLAIYSPILKKIPVVANLLIAILCGLIPLLTFIIIQQNSVQNLLRQIIILFDLGELVMSFSFFAFFVTLSREIIKDIEDIQGDREFGRQTLPIFFSPHIAKWIATICLVFNLVLLLSFFYPEMGSKSLWQNSLYGIVILANVGLIFWLVKAKNRINYQQSSAALKYFMLLGIIWLGFYQF